MLKGLLFRIGMWLAVNSAEDLADDKLTAASADAFRTRIIQWLSRRYDKAVRDRRTVADDRWWWWWGRVFKSDRCAVMQSATKKEK